jgi:3-dehydroquinate synthase
MSSQDQECHRTTVTSARGERAPSYDVWVRPGLVDGAGALIRDARPAARYAIITDSQVYGLYGERLQASLRGAGLATTTLRFAAGEWNKTRETWIEMSDGLLRAGFGRDAVVIGLGGGVVGDVAGFVAATYLRGVPLIHVPTTLVAMVDSCVGGLVGVDTGVGRDLVGAVHEPSLVLIDPALLMSLPLPHVAAGVAVAVKHGLILDAGYFEELAANLDPIFAREPTALAKLIARSVEIKAEVSSRDARQRGYRSVLDFGHTVARAQGAIAGYAWLHGEALAAGMAAEAAIGEAVGVTRDGVAGRIREALEAARLPVAIDEDVEAERFLEALRLDRERRGGVGYTLLADVGAVAGSEGQGWTRQVPEEVVRAALFG